MPYLQYSLGYITKVITIHPQWDVNVYTNFHGNHAVVDIFQFGLKLCTDRLTNREPSLEASLVWLKIKRQIPYWQRAMISNTCSFPLTDHITRSHHGGYVKAKVGVSLIALQYLTLILYCISQFILLLPLCSLRYETASMLSHGCFPKESLRSRMDKELI